MPDPTSQHPFSQDDNRLGAVSLSETETQFQVWAPRASKLSVERIVRNGDSESVVSSYPLQRNGQGFFSGVVGDCPPGTLYRYRLDDHPGRPDPRSRFQPFGVHGPSQVVDRHSFRWQDQHWTGVAKRDLVIYELHIGSFTPPGTYSAAIERLDELARLGITAIEVLPLAQTPGRWNWGYDGVNYFAPRNTYGSPDELKAFVNACHTRGIAVFNDVVFNHVGPEGNYFSEFGPYRSTRRGTPWGDAFNFDGTDSNAVRQFVIDNVLFWIDEYHFDGLRLDAVHYMFDDSEKNILDEIQEQFQIRASALDRKIYLIGESNIYDPDLVGDVANGRPHYDAIWSDCVMHSIYTVGIPNLRLTDRRYTTTDLATALEHGYVFSTPQAIRATPDHRKRHHPDGDRRYTESLIMALQTHDSVGNHPRGSRIHQLASVEFQNAAAPLILLYPSIPMIFMGEECSSESPFTFFADFEDESLRQAVDRGRQDEYPHHDWAGSPLPSDPLAFLSTKPDVNQNHQQTRRWYHELLTLRRHGIAEGWLNVDNLSVESDQKNKTYQLIYDHPKGKLHIVVRLAPSTASPIPIQEWGVEKVLLDSRSTANKPPQSLHNQHCLIWLTPESNTTGSS